MPAAFFAVGTWLMATGRDMSIMKHNERARVAPLDFVIKKVAREDALRVKIF